MIKKERGKTSTETMLGGGGEEIVSHQGREKGGDCRFRETPAGRKEGT